MSISYLIHRQSKGALFFEAFVLMLVIGGFDYYTGYEVSLSILYALPIYVVGRYCDKKSGILIALLAGLVWWWANMDMGHPYLKSWHEGWETFVRLGFFVITAIGAAALGAEADAANARIALLEHTQKLEQEIIRISEHEQRRIGQDLHDGLCQYLAAIGCAAASLKGDLEKRHLKAEADSAEELSALLKDAVVQTRESARGLVPLHVGETGLACVLDELAQSITRLRNVQCTFESDEAHKAFEDDVAMHLYRIAQEAINNAIKHGNAKRIELSLRTQHGVTVLRIVDDGVGISKTQASPSGLGLSIMNYRARLCGGALMTKDHEPRGTMVQCTISAPAAAMEYSNAA